MGEVMQAAVDWRGGRIWVAAIASKPLFDVHCTGRMRALDDANEGIECVVCGFDACPRGDAVVDVDEGAERDLPLSAHCRDWPRTGRVRRRGRARARDAADASEPNNGWGAGLVLPTGWWRGRDRAFCGRGVSRQVMRSRALREPPGWFLGSDELVDRWAQAKA